MAESPALHVSHIVDRLRLVVRGGEGGLHSAVTGAICGDLLSFVMANGKPGDVWITIQTHPNTIAVATLAKIRAIIVASGFEPEEETLIRADEEAVPVLTCKESAFVVAGVLYEMGVR